MKIYIIFLFFVFSLFLFSQTEISEEKYEKGKILSIIKMKKDKDDDENIEYYLKIIVEIKSGELKGEKKIIDNHPVFIDRAFRLDVKPGDNVVLVIEKDQGLFEINIIDYDKRGKIILILFIFIFLVIVVGGFNGVKAIAALVFTILIIFLVYLPLILKGFNPILISILTSGVATIVTLFFVTGMKIKGKIALIGTIGGVLIAGILSMFFVKIMNLTGFSDLELVYEQHLFEKIKLNLVISSGIIIGTLGAVMDVSISIASSLEEIKLNNSNINQKELFKSGMNIGKDIIGTMVNTLVLAYIGSSVFIVLLFVMKGFPMVRVLNFEFITTELLRSICGSIGIVISVPLTSYFGSKMLNKK